MIKFVISTDVFKVTDQSIERHPFKPFLPEGAKVVLCGTFPPKREKWSMDFFYPNYQNDMWRVFGLIFYNDANHFFDIANKTIDKESIQAMLTRCRIGIGETATEVIRTKDNAADKFLEIVKPVDLPKLLSQVPKCSAIVTTGEKAATIIAELTATDVPKMGRMIRCAVGMEDETEREFNHWRMPSTSRAYPMKLEKKAQYYAEMFKAEGVLDALPH